MSTTNHHPQEEVLALQTAIFPGAGKKKSDYGRALVSMDRIHCLEDALWEAHRREASAAKIKERRKMQACGVD